MTKPIVRASIHPGIGIARVGDSTEGLDIGPEVHFPISLPRRYSQQERRWAGHPYWRRRAGRS